VLTLAEGSPEYSRDVLPDLRSRRSAPGVRGVTGAWHALAVVCLVVVFAACGADPPPPQDLTAASPTKKSLIQGGGLVRPTALPSGKLPACRYPEKIATPDWLPNDLPFPTGTYTIQDIGVESGFHKALMVVPTDLTSFTRFVLQQWPKAGYVLGRGDSELFEVEDIFQKAPAVGAFKAVQQACDPGFAKMLLIYAEQSPGLPVLPSPTGSPLNPNASPAA